MKTIIIGTRNPAKFKEIKTILSQDKISGPPLRLISLRSFKDLPEIKESGRSYKANALKKARVLARLTGRVVLAEDSGLEVFALKRRPGIYSSYYAGENATPVQNNQKILEELGDLPLWRRRARYRCVVALVEPDQNKVFIAEGTCTGRIAFTPRGKNGFGYDPIFIPTGYQQTFGELSSAIKNQISHRACALRKIKKYLSLLE